MRCVPTGAQIRAVTVRRHTESSPIMAINAAWHASHPMPARATLAERVQWHLAHAKHCGCRPIPTSVQREIERLGARKPTRDGAG